MTAAKILKLLLVEDDLEDEMLLREALMEIQEGQLWETWSSCSLTQVDCLEHAIDCIRDEPFDTILLNLTLADAPNLLETFLLVRDCAGQIPIVVLADEEDPVLTTHLIREGAQDVFLKGELEPGALARTIRNGIDRSRRLTALEALVFSDSLTGTYNRAGFAHLAGHYLRLAHANRHTMHLVCIDLPESADALETRDLLLIRMSEVCRLLFPDTTLIARTHDFGLTLLTVGDAHPDIEQWAVQIVQDASDAFPGSGVPLVKVLEVAGESPEDLLKAKRPGNPSSLCCQLENRSRLHLQPGTESVRHRSLLSRTDVGFGPEAA